jgi:hypothetical protein
MEAQRCSITGKIKTDVFDRTLALDYVRKVPSVSLGRVFRTHCPPTINPELPCTNSRNGCTAFSVPLGLSHPGRVRNEPTRGRNPPSCSSAPGDDHRIGWLNSSNFPAEQSSLLRSSHRSTLTTYAGYWRILRSRAISRRAVLASDCTGGRADQTSDCSPTRRSWARQWGEVASGSPFHHQL